MPGLPHMLRFAKQSRGANLWVMVDCMSTSLLLRFGDLVMDLERYQVLLRGRALALSYREYALLVYLAGRAGQVVHKRQLLEEGLGRHDPGGLRMVDELLRHLKGLLEREGCPCIGAVGDAGYRFEPVVSVTSN